MDKINYYGFVGILMAYSILNLFMKITDIPNGLKVQCKSRWIREILSTPGINKIG